MRKTIPERLRGVNEGRMTDVMCGDARSSQCRVERHPELSESHLRGKAFPLHVIPSVATPALGTCAASAHLPWRAVPGGASVAPQTGLAMTLSEGVAPAIGIIAPARASTGRPLQEGI